MRGYFGILLSILTSELAQQLMLLIYSCGSFFVLNLIELVQLKAPALGTSVGVRYWRHLVFAAHMWCYEVVAC